MADKIFMRVATGAAGSTSYLPGDEKNKNDNNQLESVCDTVDYGVSFQVDTSGKPTSRAKMHPVVVTLPKRAITVPLDNAHKHGDLLQVQFTFYGQNPNDTAVGHEKTDASLVVTLKDAYIKSIKTIQGPAAAAISNLKKGGGLSAGSFLTSLDSVKRVPR